MTSLLRAKNGDWFARKTIPADSRDAYEHAYGVRQEARFRQPAGLSANQARAAFTDWLADVEGRVARIRAGQAGQPEELSHRRVHEISGQWYVWFVAQHEENPGAAADWHVVAERFEDAAEDPAYEGGEHDAQDRSLRHRAMVHARLMELSRLPSYLAQEGISLTPDSLGRLLDALEPDFVAALQLLIRRAGGDYSPDVRPMMHPSATPQAKPQGGKLAGMNAYQSFAAYVKERAPAPSTVNRWRSVFEDLDRHFEGKDVALYTEEDTVAWKDTLTGGSRSGRTVNDIWLRAAKTVFKWVQDQKKIASNPFTGVRVSAGKTIPKGEFTEDHVRAILSAASAPQSPGIGAKLRAAKRWVPWLQAYTGARPGEITQLRKEDVRQHKNGFWTLTISPEAGTVKTGQGRTVVIHDDLLEQGFVKFVEASARGPLFYDAPAKTSEREDPLNPKRPPWVILRQKLADWVRNTLGVDAANVSPLHGWRHTFARRALRAGLRQQTVDAFAGWTDAAVKRGYQTPSIEDLAEEIRKFPRYAV